MLQVQEEVRKVNKLDNKGGKNANNGTGTGGTQSGGVVIVTGVAKKKVQKQKGELIEQNQDGHATTEYQPFRKSFYVEVPEIGKIDYILSRFVDVYNF